MLNRLIALAILAVSGSAHAATIWTLNDVTFADGGTATGSFVFNEDFNLQPFTNDFSITVNGGDTSIFPPLTYNQGNATTARNDNVHIINLIGTNRTLRFATARALAGASGRVDLVDNPAAAECYNCSPFRAYASFGYLTSSEPVVDNPVTEVPEPATWALTICGFGLVGSALRRRHVNVRFVA